MDYFLGLLSIVYVVVSHSYKLFVRIISYLLEFKLNEGGTGNKEEIYHQTDLFYEFNLGKDLK